MFFAGATVQPADVYALSYGRVDAERCFSHQTTYPQPVSDDHLDSSMPCFAALGEQTAVQLRERFQQGLTHSLVAEHVDRLIETSLGSSWTRLYDSVSLLRFHSKWSC